MTEGRLSCQGCQGPPLPFEVAMAFQPIVDLSSGGVWGYEALVRGKNGEGAATVLTQVDDDNRYRFDQAVRVKAIETAARLFPAGAARLSINFMPNAVYEPAACIRASLQAAARTGFDPTRINFEFTEDEKLDTARVCHIVSEYKRFGFMTSIDDFGAGYAGLALLAEFQPDMIKLDMSLIRDIHHNRARQVIIGSLVAMSRELGITVLAEGVEKIDEVFMLRAAGISLFQGFYFAKPAFEMLPPLLFEPLGRARSAAVA